MRYGYNSTAWPPYRTNPAVVLRRTQDKDPTRLRRVVKGSLGGRLVCVPAPPSSCSSWCPSQAMAQHAALDASPSKPLILAGPENERNPKPVGPAGFERSTEDSQGLCAQPPDWACAASSQMLPATAEGRVWNACEAGGLSMTELQEALKADARAQENLVAVLGELLDATVAAGAAGTDSALPRFESSKRCPLLPSAYLERMMRYTAISPCNLLVGVIYLQRLKDKTRRNGAVRLTRHNCQRLLLCANMIASKFFDDFFMSNQQWARVGDLTTQEMNALELDMLVALDFDLFISREDYDDWSLQIGQMSRSLQATKQVPRAASVASDALPGCDKPEAAAETRPEAVCAETMTRFCATPQQPTQDRHGEAAAPASAQPNQQQGQEQMLQKQRDECRAHQHQQHAQSCHRNAASSRALGPRLLRQREPEKRQDEAPNGPLSSSAASSSSSSLSSTPRVTPTGSPLKTLHHGRASGTPRILRNMREVFVSSDDLLRRGFTVKTHNQG